MKSLPPDKSDKFQGPGGSVRGPEVARGPYYDIFLYKNVNFGLLRTHMVNFHFLCFAHNQFIFAIFWPRFAPRALFVLGKLEEVFYKRNR